MPSNNNCFLGFDGRDKSLTDGNSNVVCKSRQKGKALPKGMTLVELLAVVIILAIGITGVIKLHGTTMTQGAAATNMSMATFLAESQSEWLHSLEPSAVQFVSPKPEKLTADGLPCPESDPTAVCPYTRTTTVKAGVPTGASMAVLITIKWQNKVLYYDTVISALGFI